MRASIFYGIPINSIIYLYFLCVLEYTNKRLVLYDDLKNDALYGINTVLQSVLDTLQDN